MGNLWDILTFSPLGFVDSFGRASNEEVLTKKQMSASGLNFAGAPGLLVGGSGGTYSPTQIDPYAFFNPVTTNVDASQRIFAPQDQRSFALLFGSPGSTVETKKQQASKIDASSSAEGQTDSGFLPSTSALTGDVGLGTLVVIGLLGIGALFVLKK